MSIYKQRAIQEVEKFSNSTKYDYDLSTIESRTKKMTIICPVHGKFRQEVRRHLAGQHCPRCAANTANSSRVKTTTQFVTEAGHVHKGLYTYNNVVYKSAHKKVVITCNLHGDFLQAPFKHLQGQGCRHCTKAYHNLEWFSENIDKAYLPGMVYLVKMTSDDEVFYKVGVSESSVERRFSNHFEYKVEVLEVIHTTRIKAYLIEQHIHKTVKESKYRPTKRFVGYTECYNQPIDIKDNKWTIINYNETKLY